MSGIRPADIYLTGIRSIDEQHRHFAALANRLQNAGTGDEAAAMREGLLNELSAYAAFHFQSEENLMLRHAYPGLNAHVLRHRSLLGALQELVDGARTGRTTTAKLVMFLWKWLVNHTNTEDRLMGVHLKGRDLS